VSVSAGRRLGRRVAEAKLIAGAVLLREKLCAETLGLDASTNCVVDEDRRADYREREEQEEL
jgi:hypothetical protein